MVQLKLGIMWDTFDFLANAMYFAGKGYGYVDLTRPPLMSFITSIYYRMGPAYEEAILYLDGISFIIGTIGLYLLFRLKMDHIKSFLGSLVFSTFPIVLYWISAGYSDIMSVSLSIWAIYFMILGVKQNSKFFLLSFPLVTLAFLARYPEALIVFPMILYLLINKKILVQLRDLFIGFLVSLLPLIPVILFFYLKFGDPLFPFTFFFNATQGYFSTEHFAYNPDVFYYLFNFPLFVGRGYFVLILIILTGLSYDFVKKLKNSEIILKLEISTCIEKMKVISLIFFLIIFLFTFGKISFLGTEILFLFSMYLVYDLLKDSYLHKQEINVLFFSWFMVFLIFHSIYTIKVGRYFITMAPSIAYFIIYGLGEISNRFEKKEKNLFFYGFSIVLVLSMVFSTVTYLEYNQSNNNENVISGSKWLTEYDTGYKNKTIYADFYWPHFSWYLKTNVKAMPIFKNGKAYFYELKEYNVNNHDNIYNNAELNNNHAEYYFSVRKGLNLTNYTPIKQFGFITLYKRS